MDDFVPRRQIVPDTGHIPPPFWFSKQPAIPRQIRVTDVESARKIVSLVCEYFGLPCEAARSRRLHVEMRHTLVYLLYMDTPLTVINIGVWVGADNSSSISNAIKKMAKRFEEAPGFRATVQTLRSQY